MTGMADNDLLIIPTVDDPAYPLGRHVWHDPRNRAFAALPEMADLPVISKTWYSPDVFNQTKSDCTTEGAIGVCRTAPFRTPFTKSWPRYDTEDERIAFYLQSQAYDPWPGSESVDPKYEGSSTDAPYKLLREQGVITGWQWLFGVDQLRQWIMYHGPASCGTNWYDNMWETKNGYLIPTGAIVGGHCWRVIGYSAARKAFRMVNSWGTSWGENGRAWVKDADMKFLLDNQGECATVIGI